MLPNNFTNGFLMPLHRVVSQFRSLYQSLISENLTSNSVAASHWTLKLAEAQQKFYQVSYCNKTKTCYTVDFFLPLKVSIPSINSELPH